MADSRASTFPLFESSITSLPRIGRGKVRDIYAIDNERLLIVTTDRLSAFDVVMDDPIPHKGAVLNAMAQFWFAKLGHIVPNHLTGIAPESVVAPNEVDQVRGRAMVVRRLAPLAIEAVARGYIIGSGWNDYQATGAVCGVKLPAGLQLAAKLSEPIFTPATKAAAGEHDENIDFAACERIVGASIAAEVRRLALSLYNEAASYAVTRGILIADTKFEFGQDPAGNLVLIDEILTADSSRFWPAEAYRPGENPPSYDKQFVRDYLLSVRIDGKPWPKRPPAPRLPADVIARTAEKYQEALRRLTGAGLPKSPPIRPPWPAANSP